MVHKTEKTRGKCEILSWFSLFLEARYANTSKNERPCRIAACMEDRFIDEITQPGNYARSDIQTIYLNFHLLSITVQE